MPEGLDGLLSLHLQQPHERRLVLLLDRDDLEDPGRPAGRGGSPRRARDDPATSFVVLALQHPDASHLAKSRLAGEACQHGKSNPAYRTVSGLPQLEPGSSKGEGDYGATPVHLSS